MNFGESFSLAKSEDSQLLFFRGLTYVVFGILIFSIKHWTIPIMLFLGVLLFVSPRFLGVEFRQNLKYSRNWLSAQYTSYTSWLWLERLSIAVIVSGAMLSYMIPNRWIGQYKVVIPTIIFIIAYYFIMNKRIALESGLNGHLRQKMKTAGVRKLFEVGKFAIILSVFYQLIILVDFSIISNEFIASIFVLIGVALIGFSLLLAR